MNDVWTETHTAGGTIRKGYFTYKGIGGKVYEVRTSGRMINRRIVGVALHEVQKGGQVEVQTHGLCDLVHMVGG